MRESMLVVDPIVKKAHGNFYVNWNSCASDDFMTQYRFETFGNHTTIRPDPEEKGIGVSYSAIKDAFGNLTELKIISQMITPSFDNSVWMLEVIHEPRTPTIKDATEAWWFYQRIRQKQS